MKFVNLLMERTLTGIPGLDELLHGGIPRGKVVLVAGEPGTGKTIFCSQFIVNGIGQHGENGVIVTLDEARPSLFREMKQFGWELEGLEKEGKLGLLEATPTRYLEEALKSKRFELRKPELAIKDLTDNVLSLVMKVKAKRMVIDPIASLLFQYPDPMQRRLAILALMETAIATGATCLMTTELRFSGLERPVQVEEYLAHGVIILRNMPVQKSMLRVLQVEKMRETEIDMQPRPYRIGARGIEVFPQESVFQ